jgi:hypothetical protein
MRRRPFFARGRADFLQVLELPGTRFRRIEGIQGKVSALVALEDNGDNALRELPPVIRAHDPVD